MISSLQLHLNQKLLLSIKASLACPDASSDLICRLKNSHKSPRTSGMSRIDLQLALLPQILSSQTCLISVMLHLPLLLNVSSLHVFTATASNKTHMYDQCNLKLYAWVSQ